MNEQAKFWAGEFGNEYTQRNRKQEKSNQAFFKNIFHKMEHIQGGLGRETNYFPEIGSVIELGCGSGMNLRALFKVMYGNFSLAGVDINEAATKQIKIGDIYTDDILTFWDITALDESYDLSFTKGVAVHIHPDDINKLYDQLYRLSSRFILMAEYYSPRREMIEYRGHKDRLWKANFHDEMMERHPDLKLLDYGFVGHWDEYPQDDLAWWLWEKPCDAA